MMRRIAGSALAHRGRTLLNHVDPVTAIAGLCALASMAFVAPDAAYLGYFDLKTLACLFCFFACVNSLCNQGLFVRVVDRAVSHIQTPRKLVFSLVFLTAAVSAFATNDVSLIMLLPVSVELLRRLGRLRFAPELFVLQAAAANLCGMITPFGSPHNMFLYTHFSMAPIEFASAVLPAFSVSVILLALCCLLLAWWMEAVGAGESQPGPSSAEGVGAVLSGLLKRMKAVDAARGGGGVGRVDSPAAAKTEVTNVMEAMNVSGVRHLPGAGGRRRTVVALGLFGVSLAALVGVIPFGLAFVMVVAVLAAMDRAALRDVDYGLLLTFVFFFIFAGNLARIPQANDLVSGLVSFDPVLAAALVSQVISNVPAALLLSGFTPDYLSILVGVNIGGVGTPVASLASLIAIGRFARLARAESELFLGGFMVEFLAVNSVFLGILLAVQTLLVG